MCVTERDLGGRSGSGDLRLQQIPALAPGKEKLHAEAATVFKVGGDVKRRNLMPGQQRATESGKEEHVVYFCVSAVLFWASETITAHHSTELWGHGWGLVGWGGGLQHCYGGHWQLWSSEASQAVSIHQSTCQRRKHMPCGSTRPLGIPRNKLEGEIAQRNRRRSQWNSNYYSSNHGLKTVNEKTQKETVCKFYIACHSE